MKQPYMRPAQMYKVFEIDLATIDMGGKKPVLAGRRWVEYAFFEAKDETEAVQIAEQRIHFVNGYTATGLHDRVLGCRFVRVGGPA